MLWNRLKQFTSEHDGHFMVFGDMNVSRDESERFGPAFKRDEDITFNEFIMDAGLDDVCLGGRRFTWMNKAATKMSRIDRMMISANVSNDFEGLSLVALNRGCSDHTPLFFHNAKTNYGPLPFKFFNSWLKTQAFDAMIRDTVIECSNEVNDSFHAKLKFIKSKIKNWRILMLELKIDDQAVCHDEPVNRRNRWQELDKLQELEDLDSMQKARIKWDVEGDEN
ncbi:uncharacterized protein [Rutidosis leptorrhynchoides]|uniref:uncharacterized protein n=1 Tax=Rutidosis leptorrhynchoides TaxID=125765 RepID=UPI003A99F364